MLSQLSQLGMKLKDFWLITGAFGVEVHVGESPSFWADGLGWVGNCRELVLVKTLPMLVDDLGDPARTQPTLKSWPGDQAVFGLHFVLFSFRFDLAPPL